MKEMQTNKHDSTKSSKHSSDKEHKRYDYVSLWCIVQPFECCLTNGVAVFLIDGKRER